MVVIAPTETKLGNQVKKKLGRSGRYGKKIHGGFQYGEEEPILGEAQYGWRAYGETKYGNAYTPFGIYRIQTKGDHQVLTKQDFYIPSNPRTSPQQTNRSKFADAVLAWQGLTPTQKDVYNERAKYKNLSGYNLYLSEYLLSN